jgi:hypothetical protein
LIARSGLFVALICFQLGVRGAHGEVLISVGNMCSALSIMLEVPDPPRLRTGVRDHSLVLWWLNRWVFNTQLLRPRYYLLGLQPSLSVLNI